MIQPIGAVEAAPAVTRDAAPDTGEEEGVSGVAVEAPPSGDDGAPVGPGEGEEASFLAEQRIASGVAAPPARNGDAGMDDPEPGGSLPPLEDLVNRIPASTRALLDELFRAKFVTVKRVPKSALK